MAKWWSWSSYDSGGMGAPARRGRCARRWRPYHPTMRFVLAATILLLACSDDSQPIEPDPTSSSGSTQPTTSSTGAGGDGQGGDGAGGGNMQALGYENGSRLRARVLVGADGSKQFYGWWDSSLGLQCSFRLADDGAQRCLPDTQASYTDGQSGYFSNGSCTAQLAVSYCTTTVPTHALRSTGCPARYDVAELGPQYSGPVYEKVNGQCNAAVAPASGVLYQLADDLPAATFAAANIETE